MRNHILIYIACFFISMQMQAQSKLPGNFYLSKLKNGLEILVIEDSSVPLATVEICVKNGSYTEDSAYNGLSHLYEHMFFKANKAIPSQEKFLERINELGISFNGTTSNERVNYFFTLSSKLLDEGLEFMNNAIRYPLFLQEEMKKENPVVDGEFQRAESNPAFGLIQDFDKAMWGNLYYRKNAIGLHDVILTATPEKMRVIKEKYYYPNNSILVIAGDVKRDEVFSKVDKLMGDWQPCDFDPFAKWPIPEFAPIGTNKTFLTTSENAKVPMLTVGWHGPDTRNDLKATYAADVFTTILGLTSSEFQRMLVDSGLAFNANIGYQTCKYTGPIQAFLVINPAKIKEAYSVLQKQIERFDADDYFTNEQLETAKTQLAIQDAYGKEKTSAYVHTVTFWWASASIDYYTNYAENLNKVTRADIQEFVRKYIKGKSSVTGLLVSSSLKKAMNIESFESITK